MFPLKRKLLYDFTKIQLLSGFFMVVTLFGFTGIMVWNHTINLYKQRLITITKLIEKDLYNHQKLFSEKNIDPKILRDTLHPELFRIIDCYPIDYTIGFYSRRFDQVILGISKDKSVQINDIILPPNDPGRNTWITRNPIHTLHYSKLRHTYILKCDYPVVLNGQVIGHSFANITLNGLLRIFLKFALGLLTFYLIIAWLAMKLVKRVKSRIQSNLNRLLLNNDANEPNHYDYVEFESIAKQNFEAHQKIKKILESITDCYFVLDKDWRLVQANNNALNTLGATWEYIKGKHFQDISPCAYNIIYERYHSIMVTQESQHFEVYLQEADNWVEVHAYPTEDGGIAAYYRNITPRKRLELDLEMQKEKLSVTLNSIGDGVIAVDTDQRITLMNKNAELLIGWQTKEVINQHITKALYLINNKTSTPYETLIPLVLATGKYQYLTHAILVTADLQEIPVDLNCSPIITKDGRIQGAVLVFRNITDHLKMDKELLRTAKLDSISVLAGGIAHDFNNYLAAILPNLQLAKAMLAKGKNIEKNLDRAIDTTIKAGDLTKQLLTFAKTGIPAKKIASINQLLEDLVEFNLHGSKVKAVFSIAEDLWNAEFDPGQLTQVINNLVINAKQSMPQGGILEVSAKNTILKDKPFIKLAFKDHGHGISKDIIDKIFDPFFTTKDDGTGLGLSTSYSIIKKHAGEIEVSSTVGYGTTFYIYLPANPLSLEIQETAASSHQSSRESLRAHSILLMDDEEIIRSAMKDTLNHLGLRVEVAKDGAEAIELYDQSLQDGSPFDLVILDLTVPGGLGGQETLNRLKVLDPSVKAIISSGYSENVVISEYQRYGFIDVISKPLGIEQLIAVISKHLEREEDLAQG